MHKGRLEAFSDGVIAIIITIMVLELKVPHGHDLASLLPLTPVLMSYVLSFVFLGIYWNNHHHLLQAVHRVSGGILWANLHLLFWLSLVPFVTAWMGETEFEAAPVSAYGMVLLGAAIAYYVLTHGLIAHQPEGSHLQRAIGRDRKGQLSMIGYIVGIPIALVVPWLAGVLYFLVAITWLVPERRIERT